MKLTHYLVLAAAALSFSACNSSSDPVKTQYVDIVTLESSTESGSVMTYRVLDDSPEITLTSSQSFSKDQIGKRIFIMYTSDNDDKHGVSGPVSIQFAGPTLGGGAAPLPASVDSLNNWHSEEIQYMQAYRSGKYLNLGMTLPTTNNPEIRLLPRCSQREFGVSRTLDRIQVEGRIRYAVHELLRFLRHQRYLGPSEREGYQAAL